MNYSECCSPFLSCMPSAVHPQLCRESAQENQDLLRPPICPLAFCFTLSTNTVLVVLPSFLPLFLDSVSHSLGWPQTWHTAKAGLAHGILLPLLPKWLRWQKGVTSPGENVSELCLFVDTTYVTCFCVLLNYKFTILTEQFKLTYPRIKSAQ